MANLGTFIMVAVLAMSLVLIYQFGFQATAASDIGITPAVVGTSYSDSYNQSTNISRAAFGFMPLIVMLLGAFAVVIIAVMVFMAFNR